tara:strand:+ start:463 stop:954 length:492 start_codon:yes stop_codon:yes gene_type:complete
MTIKIDASIVSDANDADVSSFELLPAGEYQVVVTDVESSESRNGSSGIKLTYTIANGNQKGKKVFDTLTFIHHNDQVVQIAKSNLKRLFLACGLKEVNTDMSVLIKKKMIITVKHSEPNEKGNVYANVKKYHFSEDGVARVAAENKESKPKLVEDEEEDAPWC